MPFISENKLEEALVRAVKQPATAADFWRLLLESDLLVLGGAEGHDADAPFTLQPGGQLQLVTAERNGQAFLPVFSSLPRMQEWVKQDSRYLAVNGRALFELTRGAAVILNPASDYGRELTPDQIGQLLGAPAANRPPRTIVGEAEPPMPLVEMLTAIFARHSEVSTAWMIQATFADRVLMPHPVVGIETAGDMRALAEEIGRTAGERLPDLVFDLQQIIRANPQGLAEAMLQTPPFYQRNNPAASGRTLN
jgi:hypothetical protein